MTTMRRRSSPPPPSSTATRRSTNHDTTRRPSILLSLSTFILTFRKGVSFSINNHRLAVLPQQHGSHHHHHDNQRSSSSRMTSGNLRMISYDELSERLPSKTVIDVIDNASRSGSGNVVASDVSVAAGIPLSQARRDLTTLASLTRGDVAVSSDGDLIYTFSSSGVKSALSSSSAKYRLSKVWNKMTPGLFYALRVSFGVTLLVSIFAIFSTIAIISSGSSSRDDDRRGGDRGAMVGGGMRMGGGLGYDPFWGPSPLDFFYYRPYGYYYAPQNRNPEEMGFLESVFSYIFGDGDPNAKKEEERLSLVARVIRENNGAVTAEQLAPFLDDFPSDETDDDSPYSDESYVLPIVTKFDGEPVVTDDGDIIYVFPELQVSAASSSTDVVDESRVLNQMGLDEDISTRELKAVLSYNGLNTRGARDRRDLIETLRNRISDDVPSSSSSSDALQERTYEFSLASDLNKILAGGLGVVNLGGALYLGNLLSSAAMYGVRLPSYYGVVQSAYPFLLTYAVLFNVIPLLRNFYISSENKKIEERNGRRRRWASRVKEAVTSRGVGRLASKLKSAKRLGMKVKRLGASKDDVVFDTRMTSEEMKERREKEMLTKFDKLLQEADD